MGFWKILEYTSSVTIVGLLIWLVKLIFHDKLDARWHYFIWLVLLARMIVPVGFSVIRTPVSIFQGIPVGRWIEFGRLWANRNGYEEIFTTLGRVYLWGAALLGGYYFVTWMILKVSLKFAAKADENTWKYVEDIAVKHGLKGCSDIRICKSSTPYICGLIRPVLALPADNMRPGEPIIVHELLHRKWKDVAVNIGLHIIRVVNWFNPVVWFLTGVVQNDSEALCDQRVLEYYSEDMEKDYGEMLLSMTRNKKWNPMKAGTSNMAGSYRNMRTRIRRICDFRRVPVGIGFVAFCITLMLAVAGIGASAETRGFEIHEFKTDRELQGELLKAQLYHAHTPEEAVYLFLRAVAEHNVFYRMSVLPQERAEAYEEFVQSCWQQGSLTAKGGLTGNSNLIENVGLWSGEQGGYFPQEIFDAKQQYRIYNLQYDEDQGTATVFTRLSGGEEGTNYAEWELALTRENGWKVWLAGDTGREAGEYREPSLLYGSTQIGDFVLEMSAYNEGHFDQMEWPAALGGWKYLSNDQGTTDADIFPDSFSMEYKMSEYYITYVGKESLGGHFVRVEITKDGEAVPDAVLPTEILNEESVESMADGINSSFGAGYVNAAVANGAYGASGDGYDIAGFDGSDLAAGEPRLIGGGGTGSTEAVQGWKADDRICAYVRIYMDGRLVEEGEIWNENR